MNTTTEALQVAKGISDYGIMIIIVPFSYSCIRSDDSLFPLV